MLLDCIEAMTESNGRKKVLVLMGTARENHLKNSFFHFMEEEKHVPTSYRQEL